MADPLDARRAAPEDALAALRGEIDALDDALHDLLMRRAAVVARLAASRVKGGAASPLRPGREAAILRRLLRRHSGPLPPVALVRLWREILGASSALQGGFAVALPGGDAALAEAARTHFGPMAALRREPDAAAALDALAAGGAQAAVLPVPAAEGAGDWWTGFDPSRVRVVARLPFFAAGPAPQAVLVSRDDPDPSGDDRALLRLVSAADLPDARGPVLDALGQSGLAARSLLLCRGRDGLRALAEVDGPVGPDDPRLATLRARLPLDEARPLGFYATPVRPGADGGE